MFQSEMLESLHYFTFFGMDSTVHSNLKGSVMMFAFSKKFPLFATFPVFIVFASFGSFNPAFSAETTAVYGYVEGQPRPQLISAAEIERLRTLSFEQNGRGVSTWLGIISGMNTNSPRLHLIDTEHFKTVKTEYGVHQAYAESMGLVSGAQDFINKLNGSPQTRSIFPFTLFVPNQAIRNKDGISARWVFQNRRYRFRDSSASFSNSLVKAQQVIRQNWSLVSGNPLYITYSAQNFHRPNLLSEIGRADILSLQQKGFGIMTEAEMVSAAGLALPAVEILNSVDQDSAIGYLKYIQTEADLEDLTSQHIAVFKELPERIPPVAAIITLERQTPLSHINVLAINRRTLNIAISDDAAASSLLASIQAHEEKPVKIQALQNSIEVVQVSEFDASQFWQFKKTQVGKVEIPAALSTTGLRVVKPEAIHTASDVGAKAANYGRLERLLGVEFVEPGFAIGFDLYWRIVRAGGSASIENRLILPLIARVQSGEISPGETNRLLAEIRSAIETSQIPRETVDSLKELADGPYAGIERLRFRSSTNCEDLPRFNGAGLYLSAGIKTSHIKNALTSPESIEKLEENLLRVLASLWLSQAFWEREYFSMDHTKAAMAIQINPSFSGETANGVLIARAQEGEMSYWINSQVGEASVTNPKDGEIPESLKFKSSADTLESILQAILVERPVVDSLSNLGDAFMKKTTGEMQESRQYLFAQLLESSRRVFQDFIGNNLDFGIDIEFKIMTDVQGHERVYLKQARPLAL